MFRMLCIILSTVAFYSIIRALDHSPQPAIYTWVKWTSIKAKLWRNCCHYLVLVIKHHINNSGKTMKGNFYYSQSSLSWHFSVNLKMVIRVIWVVKKQIRRPLPLRILSVLLEAGLKFSQATVMEACPSVWDLLAL